MAIANKIIKETNLVELINQTLKWRPNSWNISPGNLAKMLIMATFTDLRIPLTRIAQRFEGIDTDYFLEPHEKSNNLNEYNIGAALDRIATIDYQQLYQTIALNIIQKHNIPITSTHNDTSTLSFYGEYDLKNSLLTEKEIKSLFKIEKGYNKDGRPQCKQVITGQITTQNGIPIVNRVQSGSTSDVDWNEQAIKYIQQIRAQGFKTGLFVADSKLMTQTHVKNMNNPANRVEFVSRCPANFAEKLENKTIAAAYEKNQWIEYGCFSEAKDACTYRGVGFTQEVFGAPMRLVVLESSSLAAGVTKTYVKQQEVLEPLIKKLTQPTYNRLCAAKEACVRFQSQKQARLFEFDFEIVRHMREVWPKGRRGPTTKPKIKVTYKIVHKATRRNEAAYKVFVQEQSCIVLASNAVERLDREIALAYKGQIVVENSFRLLKSPQVASVIYLKNPMRIGVLTMLLVFSLLVRALIEFRLREGLGVFRERNPGVSLRAGLGGRELLVPTFKMFFEHAFNCCFEREVGLGCYSFCWPHGVAELRVGVFLDLLGYSLAQLV